MHASGVLYPAVEADLMKTLTLVIRYKMWLTVPPAMSGFRKPIRSRRLLLPDGRILVSVY